MQSQDTSVKGRVIRALRPIVHSTKDKITKGFRMGADALAAVRRICTICLSRVRSQHRIVRFGIYTAASAAALVLICFAILVAAGLHHVYFDRSGLPDMEAFTQFEFPTIGHVYDTSELPLIELARERRQITRYEDIPPVVRDAILAAEDKNFFSHNGVDYSRIPRLLSKIRVGTLLSRSTRQGRVNTRAIFPQGGSTITQQLVRDYFLQEITGQENSNQLRNGVLVTRALSFVIGARTVNMIMRKLEEIRLSFWIEEEMQKYFGSKRRAKEEILARYASFIYMGNGQYGFGTAAQHYFGRSLASFTVDDADKAALLAGIAKSPRDYAPRASDTDGILRRRNQILTLMKANGAISRKEMRAALQRPIVVVAPHENKMPEASAVVESAVEELKISHPELSMEDLLQGRIQVYSTVDARMQQIVNEALEHGLELYEKRHPRAKGLIQGYVVVLKNSDASILAETGGRQFYKGRSNSYSDLNRVTKSLRQPGSAMKPIVYLSAFEKGIFTLDTMAPDEPISVPDGTQRVKWISNYDGQFKGVIPLREALAESRNAVAIWLVKQIGIDNVLRTSQSLGVQTPLHPYFTTALGASEVNLLELANAYRTMASGIAATPYIVRKIVRTSGEVVVSSEHGGSRVDFDDDVLALIQEGLRGVVRIPTGTAHALDSPGFPVAVMGKTGTTNDFRDALFVGSTYGPDGITAAVRIGFDDNRSLGPKETGARVALPVFREMISRTYREKLVGAVPAFPTPMEQNITLYLQAGTSETETAAPGASPAATLELQEASAKMQTEGLKACGAAAVIRTDQDSRIDDQNKNTLSCDLK